MSTGTGIAMFAVLAFTAFACFLWGPAGLWALVLLILVLIGMDE